MESKHKWHIIQHPFYPDLMDKDMSERRVEELKALGLTVLPIVLMTEEEVAQVAALEKELRDAIDLLNQALDSMSEAVMEQRSKVSELIAERNRTPRDWEGGNA